MLPASSSVSSFSPSTKDIRLASNSHSGKATNHDKSNVQLTKRPEEPTTPPQPRPNAPVRKRVRPLSQTRSYHSIFSSVRGSLRNRDSSRGRGNEGENEQEEKEEEEEDEEEEITTTLPPMTTTMAVVLETKEPENDVSLELEEETPETPSLKVFTPSPTKPVPDQKSKRPIKIRVHQRPGSKVSSSSSSPSTTSLSSSSHTPQSEGVTRTKPSTPFLKETNSQPLTGGIPEGKGSISVGRTGSGLGLGVRYGYGRRHLGILSRGNSTRMQNGNKPGVTSQSTLPSRSQNHQRSPTHNLATSQSTLPDNSQNRETSNALNSETHIPSSGSRLLNKDTVNFEKSTSTSASRASGATTAGTYARATHPSRSQSNAEQPSTSDFVSSRNSESSHSSPVPDTSHKEGSHDSESRKPNSRKVEDPTVNYKEEEKQEVEGQQESPTEKTVVSRVSPSFAGRFNFPSRAGSASRTSSSRLGGRVPWSRSSSSIGAGRPILRGTPTRVSGASGAAGVPSIQETSEGPRTTLNHDLLKNRVGSVKPLLTSVNAELSEIKNPFTSTSSSSSSDSDSHHSLSGHQDSNQPLSKGTSNGNDNEHNKDYLDERNREISRTNDNFGGSTVAQKNPVLTSSDPHTNTQDNESLNRGETSSRTRAGALSEVPISHRRPSLGVNGRVRSPLLASRVFAGTRFPIKPQLTQTSRLGSSVSDGSSSSVSSSSNLPKPVLTSDHRTTSDTTKTEGLNEGTSHSTASSSRDNFRSQGGRSRHPVLRGKPPSGEGLNLLNGNGKVNSKLNVIIYAPS